MKTSEARAVPDSMGRDEASDATWSAASITSPRRRLQLIDAMILVAATAIGLGVERSVEVRSNGVYSFEVFSNAYTLVTSPVAPRADKFTAILYLRHVLIATMTPFLISWTMALIPLRLLGPRDRRFLTRPGFRTAVAASLVLAYNLLRCILFGLALWAERGEVRPIDELLHGTIQSTPLYVGIALSASWVASAIARNRRRGIDWIDRLGDALAVAWILTALVTMTCFPRL
jgi:hypothetical protein